jgi:hypothetical protein
LRFFQKNSEFANEEQELLDNIERHMKGDYYAKQRHEALIGSRKAEQRVKRDLGAENCPQHLRKQTA